MFVCNSTYTLHHASKQELARTTDRQDRHFGPIILRQTDIFFWLFSLIFLKVYNYVIYFRSIIPFEEKYSTIMHAVKDAVKYGETGEMCSNKYNW